MNTIFKKMFVPVMLVTGAAIFSCDDENGVEDPIYEFVSFANDASISINEFDNSTTAYPLVVQLWAFEPYSEDITLDLAITGHNAVEGVDFTVDPSDQITIAAGSMTSDTIWVQTINNDAGSPDARSFDVEIVSASKSDLKLGLGLADPKKKFVTFNISDDECTLTTEIYETTMDNLITTDGAVQGTNSAVGVVNVAGTTLLLTGDLIWYGSMEEPLELTLTPDGPGATSGTVTFGEQFMGTPGDGYEYTYTQVGNGTYNVCSGTLTITYDTKYREIGQTAWTAWQRVINTYQVP